LGEEIETLFEGKQVSGVYQYIFNTENSAGVYMLKFNVDEQTQLKKLINLK